MLQNLDNEWNNFVDSGKEVCLSISELNNNEPNVCIQYLMAKKNNIIFKKWVQECEKIFKKKKKIIFFKMERCRWTFIRKNNS